MEISAGHLVPAGNFCQSSRTSRKLLPANSYQPEDYASHLVPAGTVLYRQMPPRTTISYWYEMHLTLFDWEVSSELTAIGKEVLEWASNCLESDTFPRSDYRELVELTVFLGGAVFLFSFRKPGAHHHARFMAYSIFF
ncbi:hypothetical protein DAPPUDRAFT_315351 [Daphnia pulex]|uniref:Uncharacterized protein n=1 Tax=Daphnia pulex TaxID=6669 RepID=E9G9I0_DAPPU|nr:hypothetical protein DAPPUDRAFT_315351 [Daphnia pulex]|eukprot:EFX83568.1 hypothetical protein DAPPUDRAFT_315351 [Daphnia pulex]